MKKLEQLSLDKMIECELKLKAINFFDQYSLEDQDLPGKLKLKVEYLSIVDGDVEARLAPIQDQAYNGVIQIREDLKNSKFVDAHEIIHYIFDVGVGKRVEKIYTKPKTGQSDLSEQCVNYLTAAAIMPCNEVLKDIKNYDNNPAMGALQFVRKLQEKYHQEEIMIIRRIREIRALYKKDVEDDSFELFNVV